VHKPNAGTATVYVLIAFLLYLLSTGPMLRLGQRGYISEKAFGAVYAPVGFFMKIPGFEKAMLWYIGLWGIHSQSDMTSGPIAPAAKPSR
jgi:hypothetical protein